MEIEAYEKLRRAKRFPRGSFTEVVLRASIPGSGVSGRELLADFDTGDSVFSDEALDAIEGMSLSLLKSARLPNHSYKAVIHDTAFSFLLLSKLRYEHAYLRLNDDPGDLRPHMHLRDWLKLSLIISGKGFIAKFGRYRNLSLTLKRLPNRRGIGG